MKKGKLECALRALWLVTPFTATLSITSVAVALSTHQWLHSEEKMENHAYNGTPGGPQEYLSKFTVSGLWKLCYTEPGGEEYSCMNIDYFPKEEYSPDPNDSTMAIPYAVTNSAIFYLSATVLLIFGEISCALGHCSHRRRIWTFISGVVFIVSGLIMLIGLVIYISTFKGEIGSKLRPKSTFQTALFTYRYGYSFLLVVCGFMASEMTGTCAVFLYIYWHRLSWLRKSSSKMELCNAHQLCHPNQQLANHEASNLHNLHPTVTFHDRHLPIVSRRQDASTSTSSSRTFPSLQRHHEQDLFNYSNAFPSVRELGTGFKRDNTTNTELIPSGDRSLKRITPV